MKQLSRIAAVAALTMMTVPAGAQATAPPGMQAGGLVPPSSQSGPPAPQPLQPTATQKRLEQADSEDSGRGLEFVYFGVEGGFQHAALQNIHKSGDLVAGSVRTNDVGALLGATIGVRLLFLTIGPRFRFAHFHDWDLWSLNLDAGWRIPLGNFEPYGMLSGGYSRLANSADGVLGSGNAVSVKGFNVRLGGGVDYFITNVLSVGGVVTVELLGLSRGAVGQTGAYAADSSALGIGLAGSAVAGLHF